MSDYTPTTEDMRGYYRETWFHAPHTNDIEEKDEEFDRWLEQFRKTDRLKERERIIALLESESEIYEDKLIDPHELIERIKVDNK